MYLREQISWSLVLDTEEYNSTTTFPILRYHFSSLNGVHTQPKTNRAAALRRNSSDFISFSSGTISLFGQLSELVVKIVGRLKDFVALANTKMLFLNSLGE